MFDGETYSPKRDGERLFAQLNAVRSLMGDSNWRTLQSIAARTHSPEASVSARLRDLRKAKFGGSTVQRRYVGAGIWEYRV